MYVKGDCVCSVCYGKSYFTQKNQAYKENRGKFPYGSITFPSPIHLTLKTLSKLPDNMSYPDEIRTDEEEKLYRSLLIKKIKRKYLISSFFSIGAFAILNDHFEIFK